jgi:hypothetical protein
MKVFVTWLLSKYKGKGKATIDTLSYLSKLSTDCPDWLACANIAVPACCKIWARVSAAVS